MENGLEGVALRPVRKPPMPAPITLARSYLLWMTLLAFCLFLGSLAINIYLFQKTQLSSITRLEETLQNRAKDLDSLLLSMISGFSNVCSVFYYDTVLPQQYVQEKILPFSSNKEQFYTPILFKNAYEGCLLYGNGTPEQVTRETQHKINQLLAYGPEIFEFFLKTFPQVWRISYLCDAFKLICPWSSFPPDINPEWLQDAKPLAGMLSFPLLHEEAKWLPFAYKSVEKIWYMQYIRPILSAENVIGSFSFSIPQSFFADYISSFKLPFGKILLTDQENAVLASQVAGNPTQTKVEFLEKVIPSILFVNQKDMFFSKPGKFKFQHIGAHTGFWTAVIPLKEAPWKIIFVCSWWEAAASDIQAIFFGNLMLLIASIILLFYSYVLLKRYFIEPSYQLIQQIEHERHGQSISTKNLPSAWDPWRKFISKIFSENQSLIIELEERVQERTQALKDVLSNLKVSQNQIIAQEKLAGLGTLTAGIAHEIKNPLNFILNFAQVSQELLEELKEKLETDVTHSTTFESLKTNLEKIAEHTNRADRIVKSMLSHARTTSATLEKVDINRFVSEYADLCCQSFLMEHKTTPLKLEKKLDPAVGEHYLYPQDMGRVLLNILQNAFEAVHQKFEQSTPHPYEPRVLIKTQDTQEAITILIHDNGEGIPASLQKKIFNPFFTTKPPGQGTGLGLSISYDCVQRHGGSLKVESQEGEGSWFVIHLPKNALNPNKQE